MIYVISLDDSQIVKIGYGEDPKRRLGEFQIGSPTPLILQWVHEGAKDLESHLHAVFVEYRIRGEWFDLTPLGNAVTAVQNAVAESPSSLLKAPRFRVPTVIHPADAVATYLGHPLPRAATGEPRLFWDDRFPPPKRPAERPAPKPGCIRVWKGECLRPTGLSCGC